MKLKYIAIFALAFAVCAGWNLLFDAPKTTKPAVETAAKIQEEKEPQGSWPAPLRPLEIRVYPYLHFHEAMDNKIKKIPVYVAINAISKPMQHAVELLKPGSGVIGTYVAWTDKDKYMHRPEDGEDLHLDQAQAFARDTLSRFKGQ